MDPLWSMLKGHYIHGTGTQTVYHNRGFTQGFHGQWPYMVLHECDQADFTISEKGADSFLVTTATGVWEVMMLLYEPAEGVPNPGVYFT